MAQHTEFDINTILSNEIFTGPAKKVGEYIREQIYVKYRKAQVINKNRDDFNIAEFIKNDPNCAFPTMIDRNRTFPTNITDSISGKNIKSASFAYDYYKIYAIPIYELYGDNEFGNKVYWANRQFIGYLPTATDQVHYMETELGRLFTSRVDNTKQKLADEIRNEISKLDFLYLPFGKGCELNIDNAELSSLFIKQLEKEFNISKDIKEWKENSQTYTFLQLYNAVGKAMAIASILFPTAYLDENLDTRKADDSNNRLMQINGAFPDLVEEFYKHPEKEVIVTYNGKTYNLAQHNASKDGKMFGYADFMYDSYYNGPEKMFNTVSASINEQLHIDQKIYGE